MAAPVLILGGGASGVLLALHLTRMPGREAVIIERCSALGAGIAYATDHPEHRLNVRAANMSAFPDDPGHFVRWLHERGAFGNDPPYDAESFVPRRLYGDYLADLIAPPLRDGRLRHLRGEAMALATGPDGAAVRLRDGTTVRGDAAVVATGNEGPDFPPAPWRHQGWGDPGPCRLDPEAPVAVIGTGLTMVDRVLWLLHGGHRGTITAISRHGFMPQVHRPGLSPLAYPASAVPFGAPLRQLTRWLRARAAEAETEGRGWQAAVDGLRPHSHALWAALSHPERRRFLRHVQPFWGVHRHRIAPAAAARIAAARAAGQIRIVAGRAAGFDERPGGVAVTVRRRDGTTERLEAVAVFECRGRSADVTRSDNPLLADLLATGAMVPDALGLGLAVTADCAAVDAHGTVSDRLFALGPVTAGTFWEITAVPDIRLQASRLAETLKARAASGVPHMVAPICQGTNSASP